MHPPPLSPHRSPKFHELRSHNSNLASSSSSTPSLTSNSAVPINCPSDIAQVMLSYIPISPSRALLHITLSTLCFLWVATSRPTQNITIEVPKGTTNHGETNSYCTPTTWIDIASFLLFNYIAHGATVVSYPGELASEKLLSVVFAISSPAFGVIRAFNFIIRHPLLTAENDLEVAARSGALCMLVRSSTWKPQKGDNIRNSLIKNPSTNISPRCVPTYSHSKPIKLTNVSLLYQSTAALSIYTPPWLNDKTRFWSYTDTNYYVRFKDRVVFGLSELPDQYKFAFVPRNAEVLGFEGSTPTASPVPTPKLSSSFNLVKGMVALLQLLYTSFTLYHANGGQVYQYGFAAPGLTVLPYAVMSALNFVASLVAPHYPTLYLVRSKVMEEAERRTGFSFHYVVGRVVDESGTHSDDIVMEGWSDIAGSFEDDDNVLHVSPSAEEDERIEIRNSSRQRIYVPACPRFRRTDDTQTSPLGQFNETTQHELEFPRYMARRQQALIQHSLFSFSRLSLQLQSCIQALRPHISYDRLPPRPQRPKPVRGSYSLEICLVYLIVGAEWTAMLALSNSGDQQSTSAQKIVVGTWVVMASLIFGLLFTYDLNHNTRESGASSMLLRCRVCCYILVCGAPAIGGFVVVSQILKAYGICYKFV